VGLCRAAQTFIIQRFINYGLLFFWKEYKGITTFIVPKETEGLSLGKKEDKVCLFLFIIT